MIAYVISPGKQGRHSQGRHSQGRHSPRRHVGSFGEASVEEQSAMLAMLRRVRALLDAELRPDGYNIGINDGAARGK